jgi:hypothetical protein
MNKKQLIMELRKIVSRISMNQESYEGINRFVERNMASGKLLADALLSITFNVTSFAS